MKAGISLYEDMTETVSVSSSLGPKLITATGTSDCGVLPSSIK